MKDINQNTKNVWTRSANGKIFGVCEGLGRGLDIEPWILRLGWIFSVFIMGFGILLYILFTLALPIEGHEKEVQCPKLLGVCYRIHLKTGLEIGLVRFLCLLLGVSTFGATAIGYIILYFVLPDEEDILKKI